jgi:Polyketide cyclase / dehydrase and lipid transport
MGRVIEIRMELPGSPEEVFAFIEDCSNERAWNPDLIDIKRLDAGPVTVGSEWDGNYKGMGTMRIRVEEHEPPSHVRFSTTGPRMDMSFTFDVAAAGGGARVHGHGEMVPKGPMRLMAPLLGPMIRRSMAKRPAQLSAGFGAR